MLCPPETSTRPQHEFQISAGKVYLSPIIDCFDGLVISWSIGEHPNAELVNTMLDAAIETVADGNARPIVHSDRGAYYRMPAYRKRLQDQMLKQSMSRKANCLDNAAMESLYGCLPAMSGNPRRVVKKSAAALYPACCVSIELPQVLTGPDVIR